ncbi:MAG: RIP metalloprotease RseP [Acholeplasmataceae bacterium]|nr:RIP metalloprotease RseP [Acholeplasmataceae bacterium]
MLIFNLLIFIIVLGAIIIIHELGHFFFAKRAGILCHEFSIGMGPVLYQKRKGETIYSVRGIPIGGYVSMAGESINDAMIKVDQVVGIKVNEQGQIYQIIMNQELPSDFVGVIKSYDLYGKDFDPLFIELEIEGKNVNYPVLRDAIYRFADKKEMWITPSEKSFESKTLWQRFLVIFAGPMMNFIFAFFLFIIVGFFVLRPAIESNVVGEVSESSAAELIGLTSGDRITSINGTDINNWTDLSQVMSNLQTGTISITYMQDGVSYTNDDVVLSTIIQMAGIANVSYDSEGNFVAIYHDEAIVGTAFGRAKTDGQLQEGDLITSISLNTLVYDIDNWDDLIHFFKNNTRGDITITYERDGAINQASFAMISDRALNKLGYQAMIFQIGVTPESSFDLSYTLLYPAKTFYGNMMQVFNTIGLLFDQNENIGIGDLSGPVGIYSLVSNTASQGIIALIGFTGFLSINIGLLNLLPIPALDGGRLVFLGIEAVTRKPLNRRFENSINNLMFFLLLGVFVYVTYNDIIRLLAP